jgi:hypothetical protein
MEDAVPVHFLKGEVGPIVRDSIFQHCFHFTTLEGDREAVITRLLLSTEFVKSRSHCVSSLTNWNQKKPSPEISPPARRLRAKKLMGTWE